ncbi:MAG: hypothetical protein L3K08_08075, partial [Thermoplasmata archaeon]|nr:hypothetical protein [Thermoplasmata archaeon]
MHLEKLTDAARGAIEKAFSRAAELRHIAVEPEHLLQALVAEPESSTASLLLAVGVQPERVLIPLEARLT